MQVLRSITTAIAQIWARGCLGKSAVIFVALIVLGLCGSLLGGNRRSPATSTAPTSAAAQATTAPEPTAAPQTTDVPTAEVLATIVTAAPTAEVATAAPAEPTDTPAAAPTDVPTDIPAATDAPAPTEAVIETPTTAAEPSMPPAPEQLPPSFANCQDDPNAGQEPNYPVLIVKVDKSSEVVTLKNVSPDAVDLSGWRMCSIKGNQQHPIGGSLAAGEQKDFPGPAASIWSNSDPDPGALYDSDGRLVSYWKN